MICIKSDEKRIRKLYYKSSSDDMSTISSDEGLRIENYSYLKEFKNITNFRYVFLFSNLLKFTFVSCSFVGIEENYCFYFFLMTVSIWFGFTISIPTTTTTRTPIISLRIKSTDGFSAFRPFWMKVISWLCFKMSLRE